MKKWLQRTLACASAAVIAGMSCRTYKMHTSSLDDFLVHETTVNPSAVFVWAPAYDAEWMDSFFIELYQKYTGQPTPLHQYRDLYQRLQDNGFSTQSFSGVFNLTFDDFERVHTSSYLDEVVQRGADPLYVSILSDGETPRIHQTVELQAAFVSGTYTAGVLALENGIAMNLAGGLHHAMPEHGEGFCIFNDTAIAIRKLQAENRIKSAMIIDADVHHGNGNATVFLNDPSVTIVDIYQSDNYPSEKIPVAVPLQFDSAKHVTDKKYLSILPKVMHFVKYQRPDIVFYLAGADPYKDDMLGEFELTKKGLQQRDRKIIHGVRSLGIPLVVLPAGGYSHNPQDVVDIHYATALIVAENQ